MLKAINLPNLPGVQLQQVRSEIPLEGNHKERISLDGSNKEGSFPVTAVALVEVVCQETGFG